MRSVGILREILNSKNNSRGFTLVEVMVALAVAAIALSVLVHGLSRYANQHVHLREAIIARSIGGGYLTRYVLEPGYVPPEYVENAGTSWELNFEEEEFFFRDLDGLTKVTLRISDGEERQIATLQAIVHRPELTLK